MPQITITAEEQATLRRILQEYLSDLRMEIAGTDAADFREQLRERKEHVKSLLAKVGENRKS